MINNFFDGLGEWEVYFLAEADSARQWRVHPNHSQWQRKKTAATITRCINCSMFLQSCLFEEQEVALDGFTAGVTS